MNAIASLVQRVALPPLSVWPLRRWLTQGMFWAVLGGVALFLGLVCVFLPWWLVVGAVLALAYPLLLWFAPWLGIGAYALALIVSPDFKVSDLLTACSLGLLAFKLLGSTTRATLPRSELRPFLVFLALVLLSLALALGVFGNTVPYIYRDGRAFLYWLWLPLLYWLAVREVPGGVKLARVMAFMAIAVSVIALLQYSFDIQIAREGRVGGLETLGVVENDLTRVQMQGYSFVMVGLAWALVMATRGGRRLFLALPLILLFAAALYVNFGRALWAWSLLAVLLCGVVLGLRRAALLGSALVVLGALGLASLAMLRPAVIDSAVNRIASVADEGAIRTSGGWRRLENEASAARIRQSPLVGIGLGGEYRPWLSEIRSFSEHTRYVHNGYVFIAVKLGIPALVVLLWLTLAPWWRAFRRRRQVAVGPQAMWFAVVASWLPVMGLSFTQPEIVTPQTVLLMCMGLAMMIHRTPAADAVQGAKAAAATAPALPRRT
ncbi:MAG: O-antigen ligase family protein [Rubrivivax sp.]|nr:O-antigen ligase family protein [Rubrivivax sp.]